ncbi:class III chitinase [Clavulina sp. PMI_390]|nr:class III chitinase [Clavulina sp. PMI_390]
MPSTLFVAASLVSSLVSGAFAYSDTCNTNVAGYWGQNSYGAVYTTDTANWQQRLSYYCQDNSLDVIPIAFVPTFQSTGGYPVLNLGNTCNSTNAQYFTGTSLLNCQFLAADIQTCQSKGKKVTISLGGGGAGLGTLDASFADQLWNLFLGGTSSDRPFGTAVLDGVDLDIESGSGPYTAFVNQLRSHFSGASKKYYITAAPQCAYPDAALMSTLNAASFDAIYVQFYNTGYCAVTQYGTTGFNFGNWDYWANRISPNPSIKVYLGVPASTSAGSGYVSASQVGVVAADLQKKFPSFGGVMFWDESQAYVNGRFDTGVKNAITASGSCSSFVYPSCTAQAWSASGNYAAGAQVTYDNYIWQARYAASGTPTPGDFTSWLPISACGGSSGTGTTTTTTKASSTSTTTTKASTTTTTTSTKASSTTTSSTATTTTSGSSICSGIAAWSSTTAYVGGSYVTYNGQLWENSYWSEADTPGGTAGVWVSKGSC